MTSAGSSPACFSWQPALHSLNCDHQVSVTTKGDLVEIRTDILFKPKKTNKTKQKTKNKTLPFLLTMKRQVYILVLRENLWFESITYKFSYG
jgi:hypothetical protein